MTTLPHYRHLAATDRTAAVIEAAACLLGLLVRWWRWMFPVFDRTLIGRHDLDTVHPGATPAYAEVLHEQNTPTEPLPLLCGDTIVLHLADPDPLTDTAWWRGGELAVSDGR